MSGPASSWSASLTAVALASAIPLALTVVLAQRPSAVDRWVPRLVFLAAGAMCGAALFHLLPQALSGSPVGFVVANAALGIAIFALIERGLHPHEHPHTLAEHLPAAHESRGMSGLVVATIAGDAIHNAIDGMLIASAFLAAPSLGVVTGVAIAMHELPRELGTFAICVRGGMSPRRAILVNVATGVLAIASALAALIVGTNATSAATFLIPFAAGNFLYLAYAILMAERHALRGPSAARSVLLTALGIAVTALIR